MGTRDFTVKEKKLLNRYIRHYLSLDSEITKPQTEIGRHFVKVCRDLEKACTEHERVYMKYKKFNSLNNMRLNGGDEATRNIILNKIVFGPPPKKGKICAYCYPTQIKRAALLFDKVYIGPYALDNHWEIPFDIRFTFPDGEVYREENAVEIAYENALDEFIESHGINPDKYSDEEWEEFTDSVEIDSEHRRHYKDFSFSLLCSYIHEKFGAKLVSILDGYDNLAKIIGSGEDDVYRAALNNFPIVKENIPWQQILDFRKDKGAARKYRDLHLWLKYCLKCKSPRHAEDVIGQKIEDYSWVIKKHGLKTGIGAVSSMIFLGTGVQTVQFLNGSVFESFCAGMVLTAGVIAWMAKQMLDLEEIKRSSNREIAIIYEAKRRFKTKQK